MLVGWVWVGAVGTFVIFVVLLKFVQAMLFQFGDHPATSIGTVALEWAV